MRNICYIAVLFLYIRQNTYFYELNCHMIELIILIANIEKKILTLGIERYKTSMDNCFKLIQQSNYSNCLMLLLLLNFINFWKQTKRPVVSKFTIITINLKKIEITVFWFKTHKDGKSRELFWVKRINWNDGYK